MGTPPHGPSHGAAPSVRRGGRGGRAHLHTRGELHVRHTTTSGPRAGAASSGAPSGRARSVSLGTAAAGLASAGPASAHGTITTYSTINGARTVYEVTGNLASWGYRPSFHTRLNTWLAFWNANTPSGYANASRVWGYGAHYDGRPTEAHNNGRGFDLSRIYTGSTRRFIARHDIWRNWSGSDLTTARRHYWATLGLGALPLPQRADLPVQRRPRQPHPHRQPGVRDEQQRASTPRRARRCCTSRRPAATSGACRPPSTASGGRRPPATPRACCARPAWRPAASRTQSRWLAFNRATMRKGYGTQTYRAP